MYTSHPFRHQSTGIHTRPSNPSRHHPAHPKLSYFSIFDGHRHKYNHTYSRYLIPKHDMRTVHLMSPQIEMGRRYRQDRTRQDTHVPSPMLSNPKPRTKMLMKSPCNNVSSHIRSPHLRIYASKHLPAAATDPRPAPPSSFPPPPISISTPILTPDYPSILELKSLPASAKVRRRAVTPPRLSTKESEWFV